MTVSTPTRVVPLRPWVRADKAGAKASSADPCGAEEGVTLVIKGPCRFLAKPRCRDESTKSGHAHQMHSHQDESPSQRKTVALETEPSNDSRSPDGGIYIRLNPFPWTVGF